jgi:hypothetical protein
MISISKRINLNSSKATIRNFPQNNSTIFFIPNMFKKHPHILYSTISVVHTEIPISYYVVNSTNNTFIVTPEGDFPIEIQLIEGNYNATTFIDMFKTAINGIGSEWDLTLNKSNGKYTLSHNALTVFSVSSNSTCLKILGGFSGNLTSFAKNLTFAYPCNFLSASSLKIKSQSIKTNGNIDSEGHDDSLISIPVNVGMYEVLIYENNNGFSNIFYNDQINSIDITITDENNQLLDFNGIDWNITLQITEFMTEPPLDQSLTNLLDRV